jgi:hypothetical protein
MSAATAIPYEMQSDSQTTRTCGAACLSMVYRSFGQDVPQAKIWPLIAKQNQLGSLASTTHLMARHALTRGFSALALQTRHPLHALRLCREFGIRTILNHRLNRSAPAGHFTVLVNIDDKSVFLHDPFFGPSRCLSHTELLELWQPRFPNSEIIGNVLIGVAADAPPLPSCQFCHTAIPSEAACPSCKNPVSLQPAALLGCVSNTCIARMWEHICCPTCDYLWDFSHQPQLAPTSAKSPDVSSPPPPGPEVASRPAPELDINKLFAEIDKFSAHILGIPAAANNPAIKKNLDFIAASKERFALAHAELLTRRAAHVAELVALAKTAREQEDAQRKKKMEELNRPSPPLDGNALGHALLKNLGFKD